LLKNSIIRKLYCIIIFRITQLINNIKRKKKVYEILISKINKVKIKKLKKLIYTFKNQIFNLENSRLKKIMIKKNFKINNKESLKIVIVKTILKKLKLLDFF
jgi:hypothetical protein